MKKWIMPVLLCIAICIIAYLSISNYLKSTYIPTDADLNLLGEMIIKVIHSEDYKEIADKETIYAIKPTVSRFNVSNPDSIFHYEVYVKTETQSYIFTCDDEQCSTVTNDGWTYSRYSEEGTILGGH